MYRKHFGLKKLPFENVPDPDFFFDQGVHARVYEQVEDSVKAGRGLTLVTGPIGAGKTTFSHMLSSNLSEKYKLIWIAEPPENAIDLLLFVAQELGLTPARSERVFVLKNIRDVLSSLNTEGVKCLLMIDESHLMTEELFHVIRALNNLEEKASKMMQIILLGQEEIMDTISLPKMESFRQRITTFENLGTMEGEKIPEYVAHRIEVAEGKESIFTDTGWEALRRATSAGSGPRVINLLCHKSLNVAYKKNKQSVDVYDVLEASRELGIGKGVFFYTFELKEQGKKAELTYSTDTQADEIIENSVAKEIEANPRRFSKFAPKRKAPKPLSGENKKGLKIPVFFLLASLMTFSFSYMYYAEQIEIHQLPQLISMNEW